MMSNSKANQSDVLSMTMWLDIEQRRLQDDEYPLLVRVMLGPHEDVSKLYLMDRHNTDEISNEVSNISIKIILNNHLLVNYFIFSIISF